MNPNAKSMSLPAILLSLAFILLVESWLASVVFSLISGLPVDSAMPNTSFVYLWYYPQDDTVLNAFFVGHLLAVIAAGFFAWVLWAPKAESLHGDSAWATARQIKKTGLFGEGKGETPGIIIGKAFGQYLFFKGLEFVMLVAPTRVGKGVGMVIPNLLNYRDSVVVTDTKKENFTVTAGYRAAHGQAVYLFDPLSDEQRTHCWNPFDYISTDPNRRINDLQTLMNYLVPTPPDSKDPMWTREARKVAVAMCLFLMDTDEFPVTFGELRRQIMPEMGLKQYIETVILIEYRDQLEPECIAALSSHARKHHKTAESIMGELEGALELWANPLVDAATSCSDFDFRELRRRPMSIYIGVEPEDLDKMSRLLNLLALQESTWCVTV